MSETDTPTNWATSTRKALLNSNEFSLVVKMQSVLFMIWYWRKFSKTDCRLFQNTFCVNNQHNYCTIYTSLHHTAHKTDDLFVVCRVEGLESCWGSRSGWKGVQGNPLYQHARHDSTKWEYQIELWRGNGHSQLCFWIEPLRLNSFVFISNLASKHTFLKYDSWYFDLQSRVKKLFTMD